jgi:Mannosyltransferase putative
MDHQPFLTYQFFIRFQIKAAAIINSQFQKVLYLDSDNIPTRNPEYLFHSKEFEETGALFWPDFW